VIPLPDLVHGRSHAVVDRELIRELLDTHVLGAEPETEVTLPAGADDVESSPWQPESFDEDLFVDELLGDAFRLEWQGRRYPVARRFLLRTLTRAPTDPEVIGFRQDILRELEADAGLRDDAFALFRDLFTLLSLLKSPRSAQLDARSFRLEVLEQGQKVVDRMVADFGDARSGLRRLHEVGKEIRNTEPYRLLSDLLDYDQRFARLTVRLQIGADGGLRALSVRRLKEAEDNLHYRSPWQRWRDRLRLLWRGYPLSAKEVANRLILEVYLEVSPVLRTLLQVMGHLEVYLTALAFRRWAEGLGLAVSLAELDSQAPPRLEELFNPLLVRQGIVPVPCTLEGAHRHGLVVVTGPNSGGKTRLLQGLGLAQMLGQSGLYVPARSARLPVVEGLFASILDHEDVAQIEGRLGSELVRIRELFEVARPGSLVILDELCSGTNPSEAVEIFSMVLRLLSELSPLAFISTHFLDFAQRLEDSPPVPHLEFLQVEMDASKHSTYQFIPGVATTSMAAGTARRLGVSFEELSALIESRVRSPAATRRS
jgi:DNA mismatch repair protein MutS2